MPARFRTTFPFLVLAIAAAEACGTDASSPSTGPLAPDASTDAGASPADGATDTDADATTTDTGAAVIGLLLQGAYASPPALPYPANPPPATPLSMATKIAIADDLHARIMRTSIIVASKDEESALSILDGGQKLALTALASADDDSGAVPAIPDSGIDAYKASLDAVLTDLDVAVLMVENEEIAAHFYTGTPETYAVELAAAVDVAHARGVRVTNGGMTNNPSRYLTWNAFYMKGDFASADDFAARAFPADVRADLPSAANPDAGVFVNSPTAAAILSDAQKLVAIYAASKMDFVNLHVYEADAKTLGQIIDYLGSATGKPVMSGEMGQYDEDASTVTAMLGVAVKMPFVIWFSGDGDPAVALQNATSNTTYSIRPTGDAYRAFTSAH